MSREDRALEPRASRAPDPLADLERLRALLARAAGSESTRETALELARLHRRASSLVARLEGRGEDPALLARARELVARSHAFLERPVSLTRTNPFVVLLELFLVRTPRAIRAEWKLLLATFALLYGLAAIAWTAVAADLDLAPSLLRPEIVEAEIEQLSGTEEGAPFRGNFDFGLGSSPLTAGHVMLNNMTVGILFFASALVPPIYLYLIAVNALMLGTYLAVAGHWGQAGAISSILWCHGTIELQAIVLAGTAGLVLVRAWIRPGPRTRSHALVLESRQALLLLAPVFPLLFVAGLIEGFVSPHAPVELRLGVAFASGAALLAWALLAGRGAPSPRAPRGRSAS